jgi:hypothetical protein
MTFDQLEKICSLLWGHSWQSELARVLDIDRRTVSKWKTQGVAKWVDKKMTGILNQRKIEINQAMELSNEYCD